MMKPEDIKHYLDCLVGDGSIKYIYTPIRTEVLAEASDFIRKQVPAYPDGNYPFYCPRCGRKLIPAKYCPDCGQRIDIEKVKEVWEKKTAVHGNEV